MNYGTDWDEFDGAVEALAERARDFVPAEEVGLMSAMRLQRRLLEQSRQRLAGYQTELRTARAYGNEDRIRILEEVVEQERQHGTTCGLAMDVLAQSLKESEVPCVV